MPSRQVFVVGKASKEIANIGIGPGVGDQRRIIDIPTLLSPRIEHDLIPRVVGMQRGNHTLGGVIEQVRRDAGIRHLALFFIEMRRAEERFVLFDWLAFVVEDGAAIADPTRRSIALHEFAVRVTHQCAGPCVNTWQRYVGFTSWRFALFGLHFLLNLSAETVGVSEADLNLGLRSTGIEEVGLTRQRGGKGWLARALKTFEVVGPDGL